MSNFPYNSDKYKRMTDVNGTPMDFKEMREFADTILYWHTANNTSDFSESGDGFNEGKYYLAFGLLELLSDPNAIHRLITTGQEVAREVDSILSLEDRNDNNIWDTKIKPTLREIFKSAE